MPHLKTTLMLLALTFSAAYSRAQTVEPGPTGAQAVIGTEKSPRIVGITGQLSGFDERTEGSILAMIFTLYDSQTGGARLWSEMQDVRIAPDGSYNVVLGAMPAALLHSNTAYWLAVSISGFNEEPRIPISTPDPHVGQTVDLNVSRALVDPDTQAVGPQSLPRQSAAKPNVQLGPIGNAIVYFTLVTSGGTANRLPKFTAFTEIDNSSIVESSGNIGIGTSAPSRTLDVAGNIGITGTGNGIVFPDGTTRTTATISTNPQSFGVCVSNSPSVPSCGCAHVISAVSVRNGGSCTTSSISSPCSAASNPDPNPGGVNGTSGVCCVCN